MTKPNSAYLVLFLLIIAGIVIVGLMNRTKTKTALLQPEVTSKVTTANEFAQTYPLPTPATVEEQQAQKQFNFIVTSPVNNSTVKSSGIVVRGKSVPNADVFVNEKDTTSDSSGNFAVNYTLEEGDNYIIVGANDSYGNYKEQELHVSYSP